LLTAALIALVTLWVLARVRFPDSPAAGNPLPSLLSLAPASPLADLAAEVAELQDRLSGSLLVMPAAPDTPGERPALRVDREVAIMLSSTGVAPGGLDVLASDAATGLMVVRVDPGPSGAVVAPWAAPALEEPRFLLSTAVSPGGVSLRPVLIGAVHQIRTPAWPAPIWAVPAGTDLVPGAIVFTISGELAGLVTEERGAQAIVPGDVALSAATQLLERGPRVPGELGVDVQALTPELARATGAAHGVVVTFVDASGPSAMRLVPGDVIEIVGGHPLTGVRDWRLATRHLTAGDRARLRVRRNGQPVDLSLVAARGEPATPIVEASAAARPLGLRMRNDPGAGAHLLDLDRESATAAAGLVQGDMITAVNGTGAPTPAQIEQAFDAASAGAALVVAYTRGEAHGVLALVK
jgi:S1-C subfamily serine protease